MKLDTIIYKHDTLFNSKTAWLTINDHHFALFWYNYQVQKCTKTPNSIFGGSSWWGGGSPSQLSAPQASHTFCLVACYVDVKRVKLLRYNEPALGPRRLPNIDHLTADQSMIEASDVFSVDTVQHVVTLTRAGERVAVGSGGADSVAVGSQLVYIVTSWCRVTRMTA